MATPRRRGRKPAERTVAQKAVGDATAALIFLYCFCAVNQVAEWVAPYTGLNQAGTGIALVLALLVAMGPVCERLGGGQPALYNPANNSFVWATGSGTAREHIVRSVAQACGAVGGVLLARALLPPEWTKHLSGLGAGVRPGYGLLDGAACEFVLGLLITFIVLVCNELQNSTLKLWLPLLATVVAVKAGEHVSGPSLNSAFTFAFAYLYPAQSVVEHVFVYWVAPVAAGVFGGWCFLGYQQWQRQRQQAQRGAKAD
ncbi:aquaporin SIP1-2 [Chlorella sorokiniana]|uniref:Aquaporin SIP1-2 n=1 Tax=Chlorella sorokiniana TaxID=3076 RepID=A0A2P6U1I9_CHLSO|nr:aquaporin SIP1-2 [Chlorella sorokiniana]|eukprot:PRW60180.1 aquaporin SIP1-2 [Chlorella sorokiniana]